jgi:hypothetical protein
MRHLTVKDGAGTSVQACSSQSNIFLPAPGEHLIDAEEIQSILQIQAQKQNKKEWAIF